MKPEHIKAELTKRGYTLTMVAEAIGKSPSLISKVVSGKAVSYDAATAVAKAIDLPLSMVFPETYEQKNQRGFKKTDAYQQKLGELRALLNRD